MPFFEIFDFRATPAQRKAATELLTAALCEAYAIKPDIISAYFIDVGDRSYGHEGFFDEEATENRVFIKVHAFRRPDQLRRVAARMLTQAVAAAYGTPTKAVAVYFFDRDPDQVAHDGVLASD
jgi:phenylpyruvate tautomerase PptA (4-oxalocrotonate tautomerase family)